MLLDIECADESEPDGDPVWPAANCPFSAPSPVTSARPSRSSATWFDAN
jgi:hypothetical protein